MLSIFNVPLDLSSGIVVKNLPNSQFHNEMQTQHLLPNPQQKKRMGFEGWDWDKLLNWVHECVKQHKQNKKASPKKWCILKVWGKFQWWKHIQWTWKTLSKHSMYIHIETWGHQTNSFIILKQFQVFHVAFFLNLHKLMSNPTT